MAFAVHGGTGRATEDLGKLSALDKALDIGINLVRAGEPVNAVVEALAYMEETGLFNAGKGSVLNRDGQAEMDAGVMDGKTMKIGAVGAVACRSPIRAALNVMLNTPHVLIVGKSGTLVSQCLDSNDTIGAVASTHDGWFAAATSTGGIRGKLPGRVGDAAVAGAGFYAMNGSGTIALTGIGEQNLAVLTAFRAVNIMRESNALEALKKSFLYVKNALGGVNQGGIAIDSRLGIGIFHTEPQMPACAINSTRKVCKMNFDLGVLL
ncbi:MAG: isoaspartyl peptidase/L-asparaginase [Conexivisphaerales archaeon]